MCNLIARKDVVLRQETDEWAILFVPDTGDTFGLDPVGVFIWRLLNGSHTIDDIVSHIKEEFSAVPSDVEKQVREFVLSLCENNLLEDGDDRDRN